MLKGIKHDKNKPRMDLLDYEYLLDTARVLGYGAEKYTEYNYKELKASRLFAALQRHLAAFWAGEDRDSESGMKHLYHAAASLMMLAGNMRDNPEMLDDRFIPEKISEIKVEEWIANVERRKKIK